MKPESLSSKGFFKKSICKLAQNECYPEVTLRQWFNERGSLVRTGAASLLDLYLIPPKMDRDNKACNH